MTKRVRIFHETNISDVSLFLSGGLSPLWELLSNSASTLTALSLPLSVSDEQTMHRLFNNRFPRLQKLKLGIWAFDVPLPEEFNTFILAHSDSLQSIDLEYGNYDEYALAFDDSTLSHLSPESFPLLKEFRGNTECISVMAKAKLKSLQTLQKLTVGPGGVDDPVYAVNSMFNEVAKYPNSFTELTELDMDMSQWEEQGDIEDCIRQWGNICGRSLRVWKGTIPSSVEWTADDIATLFNPFINLEKLQIPDLSSDRYALVKELATGLANLKAVICGDPEFGEKYNIWRVHSGNIEISW
jgi:hypothetical protein